MPTQILALASRFDKLDRVCVDLDPKTGLQKVGQLNCFMCTKCKSMHICVNLTRKSVTCAQKHAKSMHIVVTNRTAQLSFYVAPQSVQFI